MYVVLKKNFVNFSPKKKQYIFGFYRFYLATFTQIIEHYVGHLNQITIKCMAFYNNLWEILIK